MKTLSNCLWLAVLFATGALASGALDQTTYKNVTIEHVDANTGVMIVSGAPAIDGKSLVAESAIKQRLAQLHVGDKLTITAGKDTLHLSAIILKTSHVAPQDRITALAGVAIVWLLLGLALAKGRVLDLIKGDGDDKRYSNSKFQGVVWFSVVMVTYGATIALRSLRLGIDLMGVSIPPHLLMLSGLSAFTFGAAKGVTVSKIESAREAGNLTAKHTVSKGILTDLTTNDDNKLDLGDFQMLVVTLVAMVTYFVIAFNALGSLDATAGLSLKDVDSTILSAFGLGQGAYLVKKALGQVSKS